MAFQSKTSISVLILLLLSLHKPAISAPPPTRIVSLSPAITETIFSLGLGERVVGVTNVCDRPAEVLKKPKVGGMTNPSLEKIIALKPDLVVMAREGSRKELYERLIGLGINTYVFKAARLAELPEAMKKLGEALGAREASERLAVKIESAIQRQNARHRKFRAKRALFVVWPEPLKVAGPGTIINDAMSLCGLVNIMEDSHLPYPVISLETVLARRPELIIMGAGGNQMKNIPGTAKLLKRLGSLEAVRRGRVCYVGDSIYRPGPRIPQGIAELEKCANMP